jgi:hypothetical protein
MWLVVEVNSFSFVPCLFVLGVMVLSYFLQVGLLTYLANKVRVALVSGFVHSCWF